MSDRSTIQLFNNLPDFQVLQTFVVTHDAVASQWPDLSASQFASNTVYLQCSHQGHWHHLKPLALAILTATTPTATS